MFCLHNPFTHLADRSQRLFLLFVQAHDGLETAKALLAGLVYRSPPFSSFSRLVWILLNASCICSPA